MLKVTIILLLIFGLSGCFLDQYALVTKDGVLFNNIKSLEDCENINKTFNLHGICVVN